MTPQEIFDTVAMKLFTQGERSIGLGSGLIAICAYRSASGLKCAVGHLIPDEDYDPDMDDMTDSGFGPLIKKFKAQLPPWMSKPKNKKLLTRLQNVHDDENNWRSTERLKDEFQYVALDFGLNCDILTKVPDIRGGDVA